MGSKKRKIRRLTIHMNAKRRTTVPFGIDKSHGSISSNRWSSPEILLKDEHQKRLNTIAGLSASFGMPLEFYEPTDSFMSENTYNLRSKKAAKQVLLNETDDLSEK